MTQTEQLVELQNGVATTTSLQVANSFEKKHKHVLETIKNLMAENSAVKNMFKETTYLSDRGREIVLKAHENGLISDETMKTYMVMESR